LKTQSAHRLTRALLTPNTEKDFVATFDVTAGSPCFGQVIFEADVPTSGNEPHHVGLNVNGTVRVCVLHVHAQHGLLTSLLPGACKLLNHMHAALQVAFPLWHDAGGSRHGLW
jgi:hypothetical protein